MTLDLHVPIADVSASALSLKRDAPLPPLLASHELRAGEYVLLLGIIGASHVVELRRDAPLAQPSNAAATKPSSELVLREELSCSVPPGQAVEGGVRNEGSFQAAGSSWAYEVDVHTHQLADAALAEQAESLLTQRGEGWLIRRFPGVGGNHLTALHGQLEHGQLESAGADAQAQGIETQWRTWHFYPEEQKIVESRSILRSFIGGENVQ